MKILLITHFFYPNIGGIEINSELLASEFDKAGEEIRVITWTKEKGDKTFPYLIVRNPSVIELFRHHQWADVILENNPSLRLSWPSIIFKKKHVIALCTWIHRIDGSLSWQDKLKFLWLKRASVVIAVSDEVRKLTWAPAIAIGNPYRNLLFRTLPDTARQFEFVFLGRLVSDKGADIAVNAFSKLIKAQAELKSFFLTIIGDGPDRELLEQTIASLNLVKNVRLVGMLTGEALVNCLNQHRFMLIPSRWKEPFGNVALEGMACGCVPIVADGGGLPAAIGDAGLVFKRGDEDSLASCMIQILNDADLEDKLRGLAKRHLQTYEPTIVANSYLRVIRATTIKQSDSKE